jgi:anti-sigma factor RsiW
MNSTSLLALIVDQHSGELTPEVVELLEAHLTENSGARAEAERIRKALALTEETVLRHPELARVPTAESVAPRVAAEHRRVVPAWLAKAASIALLAGATGAGGYFMGQKNPAATMSPSVATDDTARPPRKDSPWARYQFASDRAGGGMQIVRVDMAKSVEGTLR